MSRRRARSVRVPVVNRAPQVLSRAGLAVSDTGHDANVERPRLDDIVAPREASEVPTTRMGRLLAVASGVSRTAASIAAFFAASGAWLLAWAVFGLWILFAGESLPACFLNCLAEPNPPPTTWGWIAGIVMMGGIALVVGSLVIFAMFLTRDMYGDDEWASRRRNRLLGLVAFASGNAACASVVIAAVYAAKWRGWRADVADNEQWGIDPDTAVAPIGVWLFVAIAASLIAATVWAAKLSEEHGQSPIRS